MLTNLCLKFFEDWHQTDFKIPRKKVIFIYLSIHLFLQGGGGEGQVGGVGWKEAKGFDSAAC